jgi:Asp-tRNA(Asn)/Glu-tRNA(Gln) amidotransferase A subunit family amidase
MSAGIGFEDYVRHDAVGLAALVRDGEVAAADLVEAAMLRAEQVNPQINAVVERLYESARGQARAPLAGPFAGVPWAVKDLYHAVAGARLTHGSRAYRDHVAAADAELVSRFRAAGLIILCTSASPEFGLSVTTESALHGATRNPWDLRRSSGGSSGGAAALVAAGVMPAAHATDGGGSIRTPASCCGLVGLKVSRGRTPVGLTRTEGWNGLSVSHALTRSVRDSAALLDATHGPPLGARYVAPPPDGSFAAAVAREPRRLRIALQAEPANGQPIHRDCRMAVEEAARLCEQLGHQVEPAVPPVEDLSAHLINVIAVHAAAAVDERSAELGRALGADDLENVTRAFVEQGRRVTGLQLAAADAAFMRNAVAMARFQQGYDLILSPSLAAPPALLGTMSLDLPLSQFVQAAVPYSPFSAVYNMTGQPSISLPLHWSEEGLPIGVQFAGRLGEEALLLQLAGQLERARPWFHRRPPL